MLSRLGDRDETQRAREGGRHAERERDKDRNTEREYLKKSITQEIG